MLPLRRASYEALSGRQSGAEPLFPKVYSIFCHEMPQLLERLAETFDVKDSEEAYEILHQMKGSAAAMGALRLWELSQFALDMCSDGSVFEEEYLIRELDMEIELYHSSIRAIQEF